MCTNTSSLSARTKRTNSASEQTQRDGFTTEAVPFVFIARFGRTVRGLCKTPFRTITPGAPTPVRSFSVVFAVQQADEQNRQRSILTSESSKRIPPQDDKTETVIPKIRPLSMDCHSERSVTERGNRLLGAKRTKESALYRRRKQNGRGMARLKRSCERRVATVEAAHLFAPQTAQSFWIVQRHPSSDPVEGVLPSLRK